MLLDGSPLKRDFERITGYVEQMDVHNGFVTVREALRFSAKLRQESDISVEEKYAYVEKVIFGGKTWRLTAAAGVEYDGDVFAGRVPHWFIRIWCWWGFNLKTSSLNVFRYLRRRKEEIDHRYGARSSPSHPLPGDFLSR